jgi:hypothetical protein
MKNTIYVIVIVVCLVLALVIYKHFSGSGSSGGIDSLSDDETTWVICLNKACKAEYEMGLKTYHKAISERLVNPMSPVAPALECEKCGEPSVRKAVKCENPTCAIVFREGSSGAHTNSDRCPKCKQSATEESRKRRKAQQEQTG